MPGGDFDPNEARRHFKLAEIVGSGGDEDLFLIALDKERRHFLRERLGYLWPAQIRLQHAERHQMGAWLFITGEGWEPGATVRFFADGISWRNGAPLDLGVFDVVDGPGGPGPVDVVIDARFQQTPGDRWTPVTVRAVGGGETASTGVPAFAFYTA
jgi:hypothetical protein